RFFVPCCRNFHAPRTSHPLNPALTVNLGKTQPCPPRNTTPLPNYLNRIYSTLSSTSSNACTIPTSIGEFSPPPTSKSQPKNNKSPPKCVFDTGSKPPGSEYDRFNSMRGVTTDGRALPRAARP